MRKVVLIFPDHLSIADFILAQKINNAEVNSFDQTVTGVLTDVDIEIARKIYSAVVKGEIPNS